MLKPEHGSFGTEWGYLRLLQRGLIWWSDPNTETKTASLEYTLVPGDGASLRLSYSSDENKQNVDLPILLTKTMPYFGGVRWGSSAPYSSTAILAIRRVGKLYLPYTYLRRPSLRDGGTLFFLTTGDLREVRLLNQLIAPLSSCPEFLRFS